MRQFIDIVSENVFNPKNIPVMYHGTTDKHLSQIERFGLVPQKETDSVMRGNNSTIDGYTQKNIYLTVDPILAQLYANSQASRQGGNPVVFEVRIPDPSKLVADDDHILDVAKKMAREYIAQKYDIDDAIRGEYSAPSLKMFIDKATEDLFTRSIRNTDSVGYQGRIPASHITIFDYEKPGKP